MLESKNQNSCYLEARIKKVAEEITNKFKNKKIFDHRKRWGKRIGFVKRTILDRKKLRTTRIVNGKKQ